MTPPGKRTQRKYQTHAENCQMPKKNPQTPPNAKKDAKQMLKKY